MMELEGASRCAPTNRKVGSIRRANVMDYTSDRLKSILSEIPQPDKCPCCVVEYKLGLRSLKIEVYQPTVDKYFWLGFGNVRYFEGPTDWIGADFFMDTLDETARYLNWIAECQ